MKALFVNGSPRKNWNTHKMLESAMKGASDSGAECEMIHLTGNLKVEDLEMLQNLDEGDEE